MISAAEAVVVLLLSTVITSAIKYNDSRFDYFVLYIKEPNQDDTLDRLTS